MSDLIKAGELERTTDTMPRLPQPQAVAGASCPICKGLHWLRNDVPVGHPHFGSSRFLVPCICQRNAYAAKERSVAFSECYTWLGDTAGDLAHMTFDGFEWRNEYRSICAAYSTLKQLSDRFARNEGNLPNLLLIGPPGVGKTHLIAALLNAVREAGVGCLYCTAQHFFDALYAADFDGKERLKSKAAGTPFLVLDELDDLHVKQDAEGKSFQQETLSELIKRRYDRHLPTAILTNEQGSLNKWLAAKTLDRLGESCEWLRMAGASYRQKGRTTK